MLPSSRVKNINNLYLLEYDSDPITKNLPNAQILEDIEDRELYNIFDF